MSGVSDAIGEARCNNDRRLSFGSETNAMTSMVKHEC